MAAAAAAALRESTSGSRGAHLPSSPHAASLSSSPSFGSGAAWLPTGKRRLSTLSTASLDGGFKLETLPDGRTRLIGESHYLLNLAPATYWNLWTKEIVHSVQRRVLEHVKNQAESGPKA